MQGLGRVVFDGTVTPDEVVDSNFNISAEAKIDAYGIGSQETRHPRRGRCIALYSAL